MFTTEAKNRIMNAIFGGASNLPTAYTVGLSTTEPNAIGGNITEPASDSGYLRVALPLFGESVDGSVTNKAPVEFPVLVKNAGVATHYVLFDQNGVPFWFDEMKVSRTLEIDTALSFATGAIKLTLEDAISAS